VAASLEPPRGTACLAIATEQVAPEAPKSIGLARPAKNGGGPLRVLPPPDPASGFSHPRGTPPRALIPGIASDDSMSSMDSCSTPTEVQRRVRNAQKRVRQAASLQEAAWGGKPLNAEQRAKVLSLPSLQQELRGLLAQMGEEEEGEAREGEGNGGAGVGAATPGKDGGAPARNGSCAAKNSSLQNSSPPARNGSRFQGGGSVGRGGGGGRQGGAGGEAGGWRVVSCFSPPDSPNVRLGSTPRPRQAQGVGRAPGAFALPASVREFQEQNSGGGAGARGSGSKEGGGGAAGGAAGGSGSGSRGSGSKSGLLPFPSAFPDRPSPSPTAERPPPRRSSDRPSCGLLGGGSADRPPTALVGGASAERLSNAFISASSAPASTDKESVVAQLAAIRSAAVARGSTSPALSPAPRGTISQSQHPKTFPNPGPPFAPPTSTSPCFVPLASASPAPSFTPRGSSLRRSSGGETSLLRGSGTSVASWEEMADSGKLVLPGDKKSGSPPLGTSVRPSGKSVEEEEFDSEERRKAGRQAAAGGEAERREEAKQAMLDKLYNFRSPARPAIPPAPHLFASGAAVGMMPPGALGLPPGGALGIPPGGAALAAEAPGGAGGDAGVVTLSEVAAAAAEQVEPEAGPLGAEGVGLAALGSAECAGGLAASGAAGGVSGLAAFGAGDAELVGGLSGRPFLLPAGATEDEPPTLSLTDFELLRLIGKGGYGKVFQVGEALHPQAILTATPPLHLPLLTCRAAQADRERGMRQSVPGATCLEPLRPRRGVLCSLPPSPRGTPTRICPFLHLHVSCLLDSEDCAMNVVGEACVELWPPNPSSLFSSPPRSPSPTSHTARLLRCAAC
jgi:hypothetical protein